MKLTLQETLEEHRRMWTWIGDYLEVYDAFTVEHVKKLYFNSFYYSGSKKIPRAHCWACEYSLMDCDNCVFIWDAPEKEKEKRFIKCVGCDNSPCKELIMRFSQLNPSERKELCYKIANLPIRISVYEEAVKNGEIDENLIAKNSYSIIETN